MLKFIHLKVGIAHITSDLKYVKLFNITKSDMATQRHIIESPLSFFYANVCIVVLKDGRLLPVDVVTNN